MGGLREVLTCRARSQARRGQEGARCPAVGTADPSPVSRALEAPNLPALRPGTGPSGHAGLGRRPRGGEEGWPGGPCPAAPWSPCHLSATSSHTRMAPLPRRREQEGGDGAPHPEVPPPGPRPAHSPSAPWARCGGRLDLGANQLPLGPGWTTGPPWAVLGGPRLQGGVSEETEGKL